MRCPVCHSETIQQTRCPIRPWVEANQGSRSEEKRRAERVQCIAGAKVWSEITDTIIVTTTPGHADLYPMLAQQLPGLRIIPGLKTHPVFRTDGFDFTFNWSRLATEVQGILDTTGTDTFVLEHETAFGRYWRGELPLDLVSLKSGLLQLPRDVTYLWYPVLLANELQRAACVPMMQVVQETIDCQLVDLTMCEPPEQRDNIIAQQALDDLATTHPPVPIQYFGGPYWPVSRFGEALKRAAARPFSIPYPGLSAWESTAREIVAGITKED